MTEAGLAFPCRYPVKAFIRTGAEARRAVLEEIAARAEFDPAQVRYQPSRRGRYESITVIVNARSRSHLEAVYRQLRKLDAVVMTL